ncbi:adenylate isopentenyltransferase 5, chloroplastic-like [Malania oleifera]|uniref:adenylate isopentenyltransferase 5, chloroplastic-like n=1 Tax=Malania oleifera TaxID=397392 RepID=UPI0025AE9532|nr:adenylate isopentenyltransferase 5, chloroplastic-like [Malania oleifera]
MEINNGMCHKNKAVFIMGATGTGKSRLSIDLATRFPAEIINSDKIQVYKGLDIVTNKVSEQERRGVPHHLLGDVDPDSDFTAHDFCLRTLFAMDTITSSSRIPIIVGGSNNYIEALVESPQYRFKAKYQPCFIWLDVSVPALHAHVSKRVDQMVAAGLLEEVREIFVPGADYDKGIRRAIGVPEMDPYLRAESAAAGAEEDKKRKEALLRSGIEAIKANTCELTCCQIGKIQRLRNEVGWAMHRIDATRVFEESGKEVDQVWEKAVKEHSLKIVGDFLKIDALETKFWRLIDRSVKHTDT